MSEPFMNQRRDNYPGQPIALERKNTKRGKVEFEKQFADLDEPYEKNKYCRNEGAEQQSLPEKMRIMVIF